MRLKCVYSNKKRKKVNISQGSIQYRGMSIPCEYKLDISEQLLNILEPCDGYWDNAPEDMQEKGLQCLHAFFQLYSQSNVSSKNTVTYADCWNKKMFDMRLKLVSNALSKKNWCAAGHELIDLVALDDLSDIYAYNALVDLYKKHIQRERI